MTISRKKNVILFIDDEKICHTLVELIIPNFTNLKLVSAFNATEAIDLAKRYSNELCVVLSDIILPDLDGYEIYKIFRQNEKLKNVPFIFQSGLADQEKYLRKHITGDVKILYKPYKQEDLLKSINDVIET